MKTIVKLVVALVFSVNIFANSGGDWVMNSDPSVPILGPSSTQRRALASVNNALPESLPGIGSRQIMRDYIVGFNDLAMNIHVGLQSDSPEDLLIMTGKWSDGYNSYAEFLADIEEGLSRVLARFRTNNLPSERLVYANVYITYLNDGNFSEDRGNRVALSILNKVSTFGQLTLDKVMDDSVVGLNCEATEQVIIRMGPRLKKIDIAVELSPGTFAEFNWTALTGPAPLSTIWRQFSTKEWTTASYLYIRGWLADGSRPVRTVLQANTGDQAVYTQFGDRIRIPDLAIQGGNLVINSAKGSNLELWSSMDLKTWQRLTTVKSVDQVTRIPISLQGNRGFFRGDSN